METPLRTRRPNLDGGFAVLYAAIALVALLGIMSFAVDLGRVQCAKTELQNACDAAARYAATGVHDGTAFAKAQAAALENKVDGSALSILAADVETGTWDDSARVFTPTATNPDAVRITGRRTAARGNAVPLVFARAVGMSAVDVTASSVAKITGGPSDVDIVGLNAVSLTNTSCIRRRWSEGGTVRVATNGTTSVPSGTQISGDMYYRTTAPSEPANGISGTNIAMSSDLSYPAVVIPGGTTNYGNLVLYSGTTYSIVSSKIRCTSLTIQSGATLDFTTDSDWYVSGAVSIGGATIDTSGTSNQWTLYLTSTNTASINTGNTVYMRVYGPSATLNLSGSTSMVGSAVVRNLNLSGSAVLNYSQYLPSPEPPDGGGTGSGGTIATVQ